MVDVDLNKIRILAESAERRAKDIHEDYQGTKANATAWVRLGDISQAILQTKKAASLLNDFFYWSGKATSYRGIIAMAELQQIVEDELDAEGSCP